MAEFTAAELDALTRGPFYNPNPYNVVTNPFGMASRGYKVNLTRAVNDGATFLNGCARFFDLCADEADRSAGAVSSRLRATSTSSLTVTTSGTRTFSVAQDLDPDVPIRPGDWLKASPTADLSVYMWGYVSAIDTVSATNSITLIVQEGAGAGTYADWILVTTGPKGPATGIASLFDDPAPKLAANLDGDGKSITNTDLSPSIDEVTIYLGASLFA